MWVCVYFHYSWLPWFWLHSLVWLLLLEISTSTLMSSSGVSNSFFRCVLFIYVINVYWGFLIGSQLIPLSVIGLWWTTLHSVGVRAGNFPHYIEVSVIYYIVEAMYPFLYFYYFLNLFFPVFVIAAIAFVLWNAMLCPINVKFWMHINHS